MKQYRAQCREHLGVVNRAFGGRVVHRSPWKTQAYFPSEERAIAWVAERSAVGLRQWRIVHGTQVVKQWL